MGRRRWTSAPQLLYLQSKVPAFRQAQLDRTLHDFLPHAYGEWFAHWPETQLTGALAQSAYAAKLLRPLEILGADDETDGGAAEARGVQLAQTGDATGQEGTNAQNNEITEAQTKAPTPATLPQEDIELIVNCEAIDRRKRQIRSWFERNSAPAKADKTKLELPGIHQIKAKKLPTALQEYSRRYYHERIKPTFDRRLAEARANGDEVSDVKLRYAVTKDCWELEDSHTRQEIEDYLNDFKDNEKKHVQEMKVKMQERLAERTPAEFQRAIDIAVPKIRPFLEDMSAATGLSFSLYFGGNIPRLGNLAAFCAHIGTTPDGQTFDTATENHAGRILAPYADFLGKVFGADKTIELSPEGGPTTNLDGIISSGNEPTNNTIPATTELNRVTPPVADIVTPAAAAAIDVNAGAPANLAHHVIGSLRDLNSPVQATQSKKTKRKRYEFEAGSESEESELGLKEIEPWEENENSLGQNSLPQTPARSMERPAHVLCTIERERERNIAWHKQVLADLIPEGLIFTPPKKKRKKAVKKYHIPEGAPRRSSRVAGLKERMTDGVDNEGLQNCMDVDETAAEAEDQDIGTDIEKTTALNADNVQGQLVDKETSIAPVPVSGSVSGERGVPASSDSLAQSGSSKSPAALTESILEVENQAEWSAWMPEAVRSLRDFDLGDDWSTAVNLWLRVEKSLEYAVPSPQNAKMRLGTKYRPKVVATWINNGRAYDKPPSIKNLTEFEREWSDWWHFLQPRWRLGPDSSLVRKISESSADWGCLRRPGQNGLFMAVLALGWWGVQSDQTTGWRSAVLDLTWCLENMLD